MVKVKPANSKHDITRVQRNLTRKRALTGYLFILPFFGCYAVLKLFPMMYSLWLSFFSWDGIKARIFVGAGNYIRLLSIDPYFRKAILNTFNILIGYLPGAIVLGLLIALILSDRNVRHKSAWQAMHFLPYTIAPVAVGLLFLIMFDWSNGIVNHILEKLKIIEEGVNWLGQARTSRSVVILLMIWKQWGYIMTIYLAGIASLPMEVFEAAIVDGANGVQRLFRITLPLLKPITIFIVITGIIDGLQLFDAPKALFTQAVGSNILGGPERSCLTAVWYLYDTAFGASSGISNFGYGASIAYGLFLVIILFSLLNLRILFSGDRTT